MVCEREEDQESQRHLWKRELVSSPATFFEKLSKKWNFQSGSLCAGLGSRSQKIGPYKIGDIIETPSQLVKICRLLLLPFDGL